MDQHGRSRIRPLGLSTFSQVESPAAQIESYLRQIEQRAQSIVEKAGFNFVKGAIRRKQSTKRSTLKFPDSVSHARWALTSCAEVRRNLVEHKYEIAVAAAFRAVNDIWNAGGDPLRENARLGGLGKAARDSDGKGAAKAEVKKLWLARHEGRHPNLRTNEQFATEAARRWPILSNLKVITGWCTEWNKEVKGKKF